VDGDVHVQLTLRHFSEAEARVSVEGLTVFGYLDPGYVLQYNRDLPLGPLTVMLKGTRFLPNESMERLRQEPLLGGLAWPEPQLPRLDCSVLTLLQHEDFNDEALLRLHDVSGRFGFVADDGVALYGSPGGEVVARSRGESIWMYVIESRDGWSYGGEVDSTGMAWFGWIPESQRRWKDYQCGLSRYRGTRENLPKVRILGPEVTLRACDRPFDVHSLVEGRRVRVARVHAGTTFISPTDPDGAGAFALHSWNVRLTDGVELEAPRWTQRCAPVTVEQELGASGHKGE
jgi:hypothetical protein